MKTKIIMILRKTLTKDLIMCCVSTWWDMTSMEASAALAMVSSSSNSFQFTDELAEFTFDLGEFPETTFDLVKLELAFRSELEI